MGDFVHPKRWRGQMIIMVGDHNLIILVGKVFQNFWDDHNLIILVKTKHFFKHKLKEMLVRNIHNIVFALCELSHLILEAQQRPSQNSILSLRYVSCVLSSQRVFTNNVKIPYTARDFTTTTGNRSSNRLRACKRSLFLRKSPFPLVMPQ